MYKLTNIFLILCLTEINSCENPYFPHTWKFEKQDNTYILYRDSNFLWTNEDCELDNEDYIIFVNNFLNSTKSKPELSLIQYSIVRGIKLLFIWTQPWYRKIKYDEKLKNLKKSLSLKSRGQIENLNKEKIVLENVTVTGYPTENETFSINITFTNCSKVYKVAHEDHSKHLTFYYHSAQNINKTYIIQLQDVKLSTTNLKIRQNNGRIITDPIKETIKFKNYNQYPVLQESELHNFLNTYLTEIFNCDYYEKSKYISILQDIKIAENYKQNVLWLIGILLQEYITTSNSNIYQIPKKYLLFTKFTQFKIYGLSQSEKCVPEMMTTKQDNNLFVKLKFSFNYPKEQNKTRIILKEYNRNSVRINVKILIIKLNFVAELNGNKNLNFNLVNIRSEVTESDSSNVIQNCKGLNKILNAVLEDKILPWYLYEVN